MATKDSTGVTGGRNAYHAMVGGVNQQWTTQQVYNNNKDPIPATKSLVDHTFVGFNTPIGAVKITFGDIKSFIESLVQSLYYYIMYEDDYVNDSMHDESNDIEEIIMEDAPLSNVDTSAASSEVIVPGLDWTQIQLKDPFEVDTAEQNALLKENLGSRVFIYKVSEDNVYGGARKGDYVVGFKENNLIQWSYCKDENAVHQTLVVFGKRNSEFIYEIPTNKPITVEDLVIKTSSTYEVRDTLEKDEKSDKTIIFIAQEDNFIMNILRGNIVIARKEEDQLGRSTVKFYPCSMDNPLKARIEELGININDL